MDCCCCFSPPKTSKNNIKTKSPTIIFSHKPSSLPAAPSSPQQEPPLAFDSPHPHLRHQTHQSHSPFDKKNFDRLSNFSDHQRNLSRRDTQHILRSFSQKFPTKKDLIIELRTLSKSRLAFDNLTTIILCLICSEKI